MASVGGVSQVPDEGNPANVEKVEPTNQLNQSQSDDTERDGNNSNTQRNTGLLKYLKKTSIGKAIWKSYKKSLSKDLPLKKTIRSKLVRFVIEREKDAVVQKITDEEILEKFEITSDRFQTLAQEIADIFQGENAATYYIPFRQNQGQYINADGKLWHHFNYLKYCMREQELLKRKTTNSTFVPNPDAIQSLNDDQDIDWLKNHLEPWEEVVTRWRRSFENRRKLLIETETTVSDYTDLFQCLQIQDAKELFLIDFSLLFPEKQFINAEKWDKIKSFLISYLDESTKIKNLEDKAFVKTLISRDLNSEREDFIILYLLHYVLPPKRKAEKRKRASEKNNETQPPRRLSSVERRESFILRVETANDVRPTLTDLRARHLTKKETLQPLIVAVGPVARINNYYVALNEKLFEATDILNAVELALKIFFALDCNYPGNVEIIWVFLQKVLFDIHLNEDVTTIDSTVILGHIERMVL